jgi:hypothetical protein
MAPHPSNAAPVRATDRQLAAVPHSTNWPAVWRFRGALRALALDIRERRAGLAPAFVQVAAGDLLAAWRGHDSTALRRAERDLVAALFRHLAGIDQSGWMHPRRRRATGGGGDAA